MAVDEGELKQILIDLRVNAVQHRAVADQMDRFYHTFSKIELDGEDRKIDEDTGQTMTQVRRDEIYDKCIEEAKRLINPPTQED